MGRLLITNIVSFAPIFTSPSLWTKEPQVPPLRFAPVGMTILLNP